MGDTLTRRKRKLPLEGHLVRRKLRTGLANATTCGTPKARERERERERDGDGENGTGTSVDRNRERMHADTDEQI